MRRLSEAEYTATIYGRPRPNSGPDDSVAGAQNAFGTQAYFESLPGAEWQGHDFSGGAVSLVYTMAGRRWRHVLVESTNPLVKLVLVINLTQREVHGHFVLDLRA
ncbi:MAG: hypothetical protein JWM93_3689 [Frankiales bacterium]|nr:hypothetical protein [Frankiales bacterium]